jgi:type II secretory pathway pseudopilin PulG
MSRRAGADDGSMLVELIVGMLLMAIVGLIVLDGIVGGFTAQRGLQNRGEALAQIRAAAQRVTREIREASPILAATATSLTIEHDTDTGSVTKTWTLVTSGSTASLVLDTTTTSGGVVGAPVRTTVLSDLNGATLPFEYDNILGWVAPSGSSVNADTCAIAGTSPVAYSRYCIGTVILHLVRNVSGHTPVTVNATVDVRNAA